MIDEKRSFQEIEKALAKESDFSIKTTEQFNKCIDHIFRLISDSYTLYSGNSFSSSLFLSITVIEEVGKIHMGLFIKPSETRVKGDPLRDHRKKEIIGAPFTISMGERLSNAMSLRELEEIFGFAYSGELKSLREKAIYCERKDNTLLTPDDVISKEFSRNMLLFAIESFDDNLVGYTDYSMDVSKKTDIIFEAVARL